MIKPNKDDWKVHLKIDTVIDKFITRVKYHIEFENGPYHKNEVSVNDAKMNLK